MECKRSLNIIKKPIILNVVNIFSGAVAQILFDLMPYFMMHFNVKIISIEPINEDEKVVKDFRRDFNCLTSLNVHRFSVIKAYRELKKCINFHKPDIVHSHMGRADVICALINPTISILINTFHCEKRNHKIFTQFGYYLSDKNVDWRICISKTVETSYYSNLFLKSPHSVIYNPVKVENFTNVISHKMVLKKQLGIDSDSKVLLNVGRLVKSKGQKYLIPMMVDLCKKRSDVLLLIVGDGLLYTEIESQIRKYNLVDKVFLLGKRADIPELLNISDVFVYSAQWEGLGVAVIEAMAAKVPVIVHPIASLKEYITDNISGYFADIHITQKFSDKIIEVLDDTEGQQKLILNAFKKVQHQFSIPNAANCYIDLYFNLLEKRQKKS